MPESGSSNDRIQDSIVGHHPLVSGDDDVTARDHDLIVRGIVVCIVILGLHFPFSAVNGLTELRNIVI